MNGRISVETHACGDSSKVMQEKTEAGGARIEKGTGGGRASLFRREERVDRRRVACRGGASRSRGPAVSGYGQGRKDRSPTAAVEAHPAPAPETSAPPAKGLAAKPALWKEEVRKRKISWLWPSRVASPAFSFARRSQCRRNSRCSDCRAEPTSGADSCSAS